jgi:hypothetical protein
MNMGKTVPSFRMASEWEIETWRDFKKELSEEEQEAFEQLMDMCRGNAMAGGAACRCEIFEAMTFTIFVSQVKRIAAFEEQLSLILARENGLKVLASKSLYGK